MAPRDNRFRRNKIEIQEEEVKDRSRFSCRFFQITHSDRWLIQRALSACIRKCCDWNIPPNTITAVGMIMTIAIPFLHYFRMFWEAAVAIVLRQILDCMDGEVARRCNKVSDLGALLDTISDTIFYFSLISIVVTFFTSNPLSNILFSALILGVWFTIHVAICKEAALIGHSIRDYNSPSLYRRSYAFMVNNSLIFVIVLATLYRLAMK